MNYDEPVRVAQKALEEAVESKPVGMTEKELAERIEDRMAELGAEGTAFDTIVAAGESGAEIHHEPTDRSIKPDEPVVIDLGAFVDGACSDMTRTVAFGDLGEEEAEIRSIVLEAHDKAVDALEPGRTGEEVDTVAREVIRDAGYGDEFVHGLGHGVGAEVHEDPKIAPESEDMIEEGDVVTIEPGIYIEGEMGFRHENMFLVTEDGCRRLTTLDL